MKRHLVASLLLLLLASRALAEDSFLQPAQNPDAAFRLFNTQNVYTLLKLDTREGRIWLVQWNSDKDRRFVEPINLKPLASGDGTPGRFTLYPTRNVYTFILVDQVAGSTWQVGWGKPDERYILPID